MSAVSLREGPVFTVTSAAGDGSGSLREAIENANASASSVRIEFAIGAGPTTIRPDRPLPEIAFAGIVDGWTQPGFDGSPLIELDGSEAGGGVGLAIIHSDVTVRGLAVSGWGEDGVTVIGADRVRLLGLNVGVRPDGRTAAGNTGMGIRTLRAHDCTIGRPGRERVVVSGNVEHGVLAHLSDRLRLQGSFFGTDDTGAAAVPNLQSGIKVYESHAVLIGGEDAGNVVSGNLRYGLEIGGPGSGDAVVVGNLIGTDATGSRALPNNRDGIVVHSSPNIRIGGPSERERNVISGNNLYGVEILAPGAQGATLVGNYVGTDAAGLKAVPNGRSGILIYNTWNARIGGPGAGDGNLISGGARAGVNLDGSVREGYDWTGVGHAHSNLVQGNLIGVDRTGERPLGNELRGILVNHTQNNLIVDNVVSGNGQDGILVLGPEDDSDPNLTPSGNRMLRNKVGITASGAPCGNGRHGIFVRHGKRNEIGGETADEANVISANEFRGVMFSGVGAGSNLLSPTNELEGNGKGPFLQRD